MPNTSRPSGRPLALGALAAAAALAGCEERGPQDITGSAPGARVKFFNFGVNAPGVNFYGNDVKLTAISSTDTVESTTGTAYGAAATGGLYSGVAPGSYTFTARIAAATDKNLVVASVPGTLAEGKAYSVYLSGVYNTATKAVEGFIVEDAIPATVAYDTTYVRFVNAIANAGPLTLTLRNPTTSADVVTSPAVAYKGASTLVAIYGGGVADLVVRNAGSTATAFTRTGVSFSPGRVYTVSTRGDITVTSTTAANRPQLDNTANY